MQASAQDKSFALLRIAFGCVWGIDAMFKWLPAFQDNFVGYISDGAQGQPALVQTWINLWVTVANIQPHTFALVVAFAETAIAIGLIFGIFTRIANWGGIALALAIWSTAEGFGGPYAPGSTDIGTGIIYIFVHLSLIAGKSWRTYSVDSLLKGAFSASSW
ncbi:MAG: DoxX family protein [Candidatus Pacebacteria bacterium]|nr:DoxX family protein [Candidatus Paceibacterota bacterium]